MAVFREVHRSECLVQRLEKAVLASLKTRLLSVNEVTVHLVNVALNGGGQRLNALLNAQVFENIDQLRLEGRPRAVLATGGEPCMPCLMLVLATDNRVHPCINHGGKDRGANAVVLNVAVRNHVIANVDMRPLAGIAPKYELVNGLVCVKSDCILHRGNSFAVCLFLSLHILYASFGKLQVWNDEKDGEISHHISTFNATFSVTMKKRGAGGVLHPHPATRRSTNHGDQNLCHYLFKRRLVVHIEKGHPRP